jgi:type VI protein secretion system component Hcp
MTEISKQAKPAQEVTAEEPKKADGALNDKQLDAVTGGKASSVLMNACATGEHIKEATITH